MTNRKTTKRALFTSTLALLMCVAMLIGTTFAWFTDSATTNVNKIEAGKLDVKLEMLKDREWADAEWIDGGGQYLDFVKAAGAPADEAILWEPGCTYNLYPLRIVNNGNLALKYTIQVTGFAGDAKLAEALTWNFTGGSEGVLLANETSAPITISAHMDEAAGNEYQGLSIKGISVTVTATQAPYEYDSTTNQYDAITVPTSVWDGTTGFAPTATEGVYHITNAAEFVWYVENVVTNNATPRADMISVVLDCDIDLGGKTITRTGQAYQFSGNFDGQGHTVSNFKISQMDGGVDGTGYTGLFGYMSGASVKNLTVRNATVQSDAAQVAAIVPSVNENSVVDNCHAINCTVTGVKKVGAVAGYAQDATSTVKNCSAKDCTIVASDARADQASIFGYENTGSKFSGNIDKGGNVVRTGTAVTTPSSSELSTALSTANAVVVLDADVTDYTLPGSVGDNVVIDGNGAEVAVAAGESMGSTAMDRLVSSGATFKNVVFSGRNHLFLKGNSTFINCTFNSEIDNADPVAGTVTFEGCTFNRPVHFAPGSGDTVNGAYFVAKNCTFNGPTPGDSSRVLVVQGFEKVTLTNCTMNGTDWAGASMISYCPVEFNACTVKNGVRVAGVSNDQITGSNCSVVIKRASTADETLNF